MTFGKRLKELRFKHDVTMEDVQNATGISRPAICNYEQGKRAPRKKSVKALAEYFNVSEGYLLGYTDTEGAPTQAVTPHDVTKEIGQIARLLQLLQDPAKRATIEELLKIIPAR